MQIDSVAGSSLLMKSAQTQQTLSTSMMKQAAELQNQMANMLSQNVQQASTLIASDINGYGFSTYA